MNASGTSDGQVQLEAGTVIPVGSRRELFVDRLLVERMQDVEFRLHPPQRVPLSPSPLVGGYATVIKEGDTFRAYYRSYLPDYDGKRGDGNLE